MWYTDWRMKKLQIKNLRTLLSSHRYSAMFMRWFGLSIMVIVWTVIQPAYATWQEPTCDPTNDPNACNIAAPINVSSADQIKAGDLTINGIMQADTGLTLSSGGSLSLPNNSVIDAMVSDDLTSSIFIRDTAGTNAVDLSSWSASYVPGVEVVGSLPGAAISPIWVKKAGDTMTGTLSMDLTAANVPGIDIKLGNAFGINIVSPSINPTDYPLSIDVQGDAERGINVSTIASSGKAIFATATDPTGTGVAASGGLQGIQAVGNGASGRGVSALGNAAGVYAEALNVDGQGVTGLVTGATAVGIFGQSNLSTGVYGNSGALGGPVNDVYGVIGCRDGANCAKLGGENLAGRFDDNTYTDGQNVSEMFLPTNELSKGYDSFYAGLVKKLYKPDTAYSIEWKNVTFMESDGDEIWVLANDGTIDSEITRLDSQTGKFITSTDFSGGFLAVAGTVTESGFVGIVKSTGEVFQWDKFGHTLNLGTLPFHDSVTMDYDGRWLWAGRIAAGAPDRMLYQIDPITLATTQVVIPSDGNEVLDFVVGSQYMYALVDVAGIGATNTEVWRFDRSSAPAVNRVWQIDNNIPIKGFKPQMVYDGNSLWVTLSTNAGNDGVVQIDTITENQYVYDIESNSIEYNNPGPIIFDGQYLWVSLKGSSTVTRLLPFSEDYSSISVVDGEFYPIEIPIAYLSFDGNYVWGVTTSDGGTQGRLIQISTGQGYGSQLNIATSGITLYNTDPAFTHNPDPYCIQMVGPTAGFASLKAIPGECKR